METNNLNAEMTEEKVALFKMAELVISEGFKEMAADLHPDQEGYAEEMQLLNEANTWLQSLLTK